MCPKSSTPTVNAPNYYKVRYILEMQIHSIYSHKLYFSQSRCTKMVKYCTDYVPLVLNTFEFVNKVSINNIEVTSIL